jgi:hypothetical protein
VTQVLPADEASAQAPVWRRWLIAFALFSAAGLALLYAFIMLVDPYTTGRFALTQRLDRVSKNQFFAKAGIIRDPQFDAAIFGASTAGSLDPAPIGAASGRRVVQLAFYGTVPQTNRFISRIFEQHHRARPTAQIIILDSHWCSPDIMPLPHPFPAWVYESSNREYLSQLFDTEAAKTAWRRLGIWLGLAGQSIPANGFAPIFPEGYDPQVVSKRLLELKPDPNAPPPDAPFPELDALAAHLDRLEPQTQVLLTFLPVFFTSLPPQGSAAALRDAACKDRVRRIAGRRPNTAVLNMERDSALARDVANYVDAIHFRGDVARKVELEIARALVALQSSAK